MTFVAELLYPSIVLQRSKVSVEMARKVMIIKQLFLFLLSEKRFSIWLFFAYAFRPIGCCEPKDTDLTDNDYSFSFKRIKSDK